MKQYWNALLDAVKHRWKILLGFAAGLAFIMQLVEYTGFFSGPEGRVLDVFLYLHSVQAGKQNSTEAPIILIEIDDAAYDSCFGGTPPLNATLLKKIVRSLVDVAPRVLGVDIITDSKLQKNQHAYVKMRDFGTTATPVVWAAGAEGSIAQRSGLWSWLWGTEDELLVQPTGVLGIENSELKPPAPTSPSYPREWALPVFPPDEDFRLRRFPREVSALLVGDTGVFSWKPQPTWASRIAELARQSTISASDKDRREVLLSYSIPIVKRYPLQALYQCDKKENGAVNIKPLPKGFTELKMKVQESKPPAIILLGGTFSSSGDFHETSIGRISGLEINAHAVQAELAGKEVHEFPRRWMFLLDTAIGFVIGLIFELSGRIRVLIGVSLAVVIAVAGISYVALSQGYPWLSCIGVALGINLHGIIEAYWTNLKAPKEHVLTIPPGGL